MKVKKLTLSLALVLAMASLTACAGEQSSSEAGDTTVTTEITDTEVQNTEMQSASRYMVDWQTKEVEVLALQPLEINEVVITQDVINKVATTPFDFSVDEIKARLAENSFVSENYVLATYKSDVTEGDTYTEGNKFKYTITEKILGIYKDGASFENTEYSDMYISFGRDTSEYNNFSSITIGFNQVKPDSGCQDNVYSVIKDALGEEYAEYMVYGRDADVDIADAVYFEDYIETSNGTYSFVRDYSENKDGTFNLSFELMVSDDGIKNPFAYYDGGYTSVSESIPYTFDTMVNGEIGNADYKQLAVLCDGYMQNCSESYVRTLLESITAGYLVADDGTKITEYNLACICGSSDMGKAVSPELDINYTIVEDANGICKMECSIGGTAGHIYDDVDKEVAYAEIVELSKKYANYLFPELDLSDITLVAVMENPLGHSKDITANIQGLELTGEITFRANGTFMDTYTGGYTIDLEYSK